jgi:hypothetical protein
MAKNIGDTIDEIDYNGLQSDIAAIMGTPTGTSETTARGYNQTLLSSQVAAGEKVTAAQWDNLRLDITNAHRHQFDTDPSVTNVSTSTKITAADFNLYETAIATVGSDPNRYTMHPNQATPVTGQTATLAAGWGSGGVITRTHQFTVSFSNQTHRRSYFNAGGQIRIYVSNNYTGSAAKTVDWKRILNGGGQMYFNYKDSGRVAGTGTSGQYGTSYTYGNYDVTNTTWRTIWYNDGSNPYSENYMRIQVRQNTTSQLEFRVQLVDADIGDDTTPTDNWPNAVDESVQGTTTSSVTFYRPDGNVTIAAPTAAAATGNQFTIA